MFSECCKANCLSNIIFENVVKPMVFDNIILGVVVPRKCCLNNWFYIISRNNVAKTIGFTTLLKRVLLKPLALATMFFSMSTAKSFINFGFGNIVKPMFLATLVSKC